MERALIRGSGAGNVAVLGVEDVLLLTAVTTLPWLWGGVYLDAYRSIAALIALAAGCALVRHGASGLHVGRSILWLFPAFLLLAFAVVQTLPMPRSFIAVLSPRAAAIQTSAFGREGVDAVEWLRRIERDARDRVPEMGAPVAPRADALLPSALAPRPKTRFTLSLQPDATLEKAHWYAALLLAFLLAQRRAANERRARIYRATLFVLFGAMALVGTLNRLTAPHSLLWLRDLPLEFRPFGPYINPSHFAGVMELAVPWLLGCGLFAFAHRPAGGPGPRVGALTLVCAALCAASALIAASKMAAATIGVAAVVLFGFASRSLRGRARTVLLVGVTVTILLFGTIAIFGPLRERVVEFTATHEGDASRNLRGLAWSAGLRMARDYTWTGSGFGAFADLIPTYLPPGESERWLQLHNDYLEVYLGGGLVAAILGLWLAVAFGKRLGGVLRAATERGRLLPSLGLTLGLLALAVHETVDFNLQIPANALLFVVIAALGVSPWERAGDNA